MPLLDILRAYKGQWWRIALLQLLALLGLSVVIGAIALLVQSNGAGLIAYVGSDLEQVDGRAVAIATVLIVAIVLVSIPFLIAGAAATAQVSDTALAGRPSRLWRALGRGFARFLPVLGTVLLALVLVVVALIAAPFISLIGVLGLAVTGVIALVRRRRPEALPKWPGWRIWGFTAIPFAWFGRIASTAALMFPAAVLEPTGPIAAYRLADRAALGRRLRILGVMAIALLAAIGLSVAFALLGAALWGEVGSTLLGGLVQLVALPIPVVAAVALYRRAAGPSGRMLQRAPAPAPSPAVLTASPVMTRIALVTIAAILATTAVVVTPGMVSSAAADPVGGGAVSLVVTSSTDTLDAGALATEQASCLAAGPDCTIRAALAVASDAAATGAPSATISFDGAMTITLVDTLSFAPSAGSAIVAGELAIDGGGQGVVLDGGSAVQILNVVSELWNLSVSGLTLRHGWTMSDGGALLAGVPQTRLQSVLFDGNSAFVAGGAVSARTLSVSDSTFLDNRARYYTETASGGAIRASGYATIVNSTFSHNGVGDGHPVIRNRGSDIHADGGMDVLNSTFVNSEGGSLLAGAASELHNSIFTTDWTLGGLMCAGPFTGGANISREGDTTCPGTGGGQISIPLVVALDSTGIVPVFPLYPFGNPAIAAGVDCPAADAIGTLRPENGCDLGAVEFARFTSLAVEAVPSASVVGTVTLRATVTGKPGLLPQGTVTFTVGADQYGPVAVNQGVAETEVSGLDFGQTYSYSAAFTPSGAFDGSSAGPLNYTVGQVQVPVDLQCANPDAPNPVAAPECTGAHWNIGDTESIHLTAKVTDDSAGKVSIALDADGTTVVAGPDAVVDGQAVFVIPASAFGPGIHDLYAVYTSDDHQHSGVSPVRSLAVLATPAVSISGTETSGIYGDPGAGTFTVTVSGSVGTPTGTVTVLGTVATLDASGTATVDLSYLPVGDATDLTASYSGDGAYGRGTSNTVQYQTTSAGTTTEIESVSPEAPKFGEPVTVTVKVTSVVPSAMDPQGSVTLTADGTQTFGPVGSDQVADDGAGTSTFTVVIPAEALRGGDHPLVAEFASNDNFDDSVSPSVPGTAVSIGHAPTTTTLVAAPTSSTWGDQVTLTATVDATGAGSVPVGSIAFSAGSTALGTAALVPCDPPNADGCAVASLTVDAGAIGIGTSTLTAQYQGTTDLTSSSGTVENYLVAKATPTVQVSGAGGLVYGQSATYTITAGSALAAPADGTHLVVTAVPTEGDPVALGTVTLVDGSATIDVSTTGTLVPGTYAITAAFAGDANFEAASGSSTLTVNDAATDISLDSISSTTVVYGGSLDVVLSVDNISTDRQPEGDVVVSWLGQEVGRATLSPTDDTDTAGKRTVEITADFGTAIHGPDEFWLTAEFVPALGFAPDRLKSDAGEERVRVTVTPLQAEVSVDATAILGQPLEATATVDIPGEDLGIVPAGGINFLIIKSGGGSEQVGPVRLVDGKATLAAGLGAFPIVVGLAGTWQVRATYVPDIDSRYVSPSPHNTAIVYRDVVAGGASVTVNAPETSEYRVPVSVHVRVAGAIAATGIVRVQAADSGSFLVSDEVSLVDGEADILIDPDYLAIGSHTFAVHYLGNGTLNGADSAPFTIVVGKTATTTRVENVGAPYSGIVGATVKYRAYVTSTVGVPEGLVTFSRDGTTIGVASLDDDGFAAISRTADEVWSGDILAEFTPYLSSMAPSSGTVEHAWVKAPVKVTLQAQGSGAIGVTNQYTAFVWYDSTQFPGLADDMQPPYLPNGTVTISDGEGTSCTATLVPVDDQTTASCNIRFTSVGDHRMTATYGGNSTYAGGTSSAWITTVSKGTPIVTLGVPYEQWAGLTTLPVSWSVTGPSDGTVTLKRGAATVCTSASLVGSCDVAVPAYNDIANGDTLTLEYSGTALWKTGTASRTGTIIACVPYEQLAANPAGTATITVSPAPTCGGGTGYYTTDRVYVTAVPEDGSRVTGFSDVVLPGTSVHWSYAADLVTLNSNGSASMVVSPPQPQTRLNSFGFQANTTAQCLPVRIKVTGIANRLDALNAVYWDTTRDCDQPVVVNPDNSITAYFTNGSQVRVHYQSGFVPKGSTFYGWQDLASGDPYAESATYTVTPELSMITALFGPVCYENAPKVQQPSEGTITVTLPAANCNDPRTGKKGWTVGTPGTATLVDTTGSTLEVVDRQYVSMNGYMQWLENKAWIPQRPIYFDGWTGDASSWTAQPSTIGVDALGVRRETRTVAFKVGQQPFTIGAAYGSCATVTTEVTGDASSGAPGTITVDTAPNCPLGAGKGVEKWFKSGTTVSLTTKASGKTLKLLGWSGVPIERARFLDNTISFPANGVVKAVASYGSNANCRPFSISTAPAGALNLTTSFTLGSNACAAMYGDKFYDQGIDGNGITVDATPASAAAQGSETVFAWSTTDPSAPNGEGERSTVWKRTPYLSEEVYGNTTIVAYACEFVSIGANVFSPDGQLVNNAGAANISPDSQARLGDFLITQPADCATGSDPRSAYGGYAWQVGTQLIPVVSADPVAYKFTGWSGDVAGTGETPDTPLALVGAGRTAQGDNYHYRVAANFQAICYTLSLPSDADKLEVITAPNCPGADPSRRMYLGGTAVVIHAPDKGDTLFRNWVRGTDSIDSDPHWASVVMTSDKTVVPYYSGKSAGEYITTYGTMVGDQLAVASKKMVGFASAAVSAYFKTLISKAALVASGIGYLAQGLEYFGVEGAVIDGMKSASTAMNDMITLLFAPMDCITAWSAGGEDTAFFAAQNLIGTAIVETLSAGAAKPPTASTQTTFQKLQAQAAAAKEKAAPGITAATAIASAKGVYEAAASGNVGWESSAYDAWGSQSSLSVYSTCMKNKAGGAAMSVMSVGG